MPAVMTSLLQFGSYVFPAGFRLIGRNQETSRPMVPLSHIHGSFIQDLYRRGKTITVKGTLGGIGTSDTNGNPYVTFDNIAAELNRLEEQLANGYQNFSAGYADGRYLVCQKKKMTVTPVPSQGRTCVDVDLELYAYDPRWLIPGTKHAVISKTNAWVSGDGNVGPGFLSIGGSAIAYPLISIPGPLGSGGIFQVAFEPGARWQPWYVHGGYIGLALSGFTTTGAETLVIDCNPFNRANALQINGNTVTGYQRVGQHMGNRNDYGDDFLFPYLLPNLIFDGLELSGTEQDNAVTGVISQSIQGNWDLYWQEAWAA